MSVLDNAEKMTSEQALNRWGWGIDLSPASTVYRYVVGSTVIWIGLSNGERWTCNVECESGVVGDWDGKSPYDAMLNGVLESVVKRAVKEYWDEPKERDLKHCCEDVVNGLAYYGFQVIHYGWEKVGELFPHSPECTPQTEDDYELLDDLMGHAIRFMALYGKRYGVDFEDVWTD